MPTSIDFTDTIGATSLTNKKPSPGDRFDNWLPITRPYGDIAARQSDGASSMFVYRTEYAVQLELSKIPSRTIGGIVMTDIADRLCYWLASGGTVQITTGDAVSSVYPTCGIYPGTVPDLQLTDRQLLEYTFKAKLLNLAGSPVRMVCRYDDQ